MVRMNGVGADSCLGQGWNECHEEFTKHIKSVLASEEEWLANYLCEWKTNDACCLPDLTEHSRKLMFGRAREILSYLKEELL